MERNRYMKERGVKKRRTERKRNKGIHKSVIEHVYACVYFLPLMIGHAILSKRKEREENTHTNLSFQRNVECGLR